MRQQETGKKRCPRMRARLLYLVTVVTSNKNTRLELVTATGGRTDDNWWRLTTGRLALPR